MENVRIASTRLAGLRSVGPEAARDFYRVMSGLAAIFPNRPDLLQFFAEPVATRDRASTDWYAPHGRVYTPLSALPDDRRAEAVARVEEVLQLLHHESDRLRNAGDANGDVLAAAANVPAPIEQFIYVSRDVSGSADWFPVLVGWGHTNDAPYRTGALPEAIKRASLDSIRREQVVLPPGGSAYAPAAFSAAPAAFATAPAMVAPARSAWRWLLWLLLLLLLILAICWVLFRACAVIVPGLGILPGIGQAFCPATAIAADADRARTLNELARKLELEVAQKGGACTTEANRGNSMPLSRPGDTQADVGLPHVSGVGALPDDKRVADDQRPPDQRVPDQRVPDDKRVADDKRPADDKQLPDPRTDAAKDKNPPAQPPLTPLRPNSMPPPTQAPLAGPDMDKRLADAKAKGGEFQVSLAWDGKADLDLRVTCPNGEEISYTKRNSCGGTFDIDMNGPDLKSPTPVENAFWPQGRAPKGKYKVGVNLYERNGDNRPEIPFQLRIKDGDKVKVVPGSISQERKVVNITEVER